MIDTIERNERPVTVVTDAGEYHAGVMRDGRLLTDEACNLDDATGRRVVDAIPDGTPAVHVCRRCYPVLGLEE